jgi:YD repeat-containing protein
LETTYKSDGLGRVTQITEPKTNPDTGTPTSVTTITYTDLADYSEVRTTPPTVTSGGMSPPIQVVRADHRTATVDVLTLSSADASKVLTLNRSIYADTTRTSSQPDTGLLYVVERYSATGGLTYSTANGIGGDDDKNRTEYAYDARGRQTRVAAGTGIYTDSMSTTSPTITRTVYDALGRPTQTWIGTDDTGWSPASPGTNMTLANQNVYDDGDVGDGNLTQTTQDPNGEARVTGTKYDWRDRPVLTMSGVGAASGTHPPITLLTYDNVGRVVAQHVYDGDGVTFSTLDPGTADTTLASDRRAFTETLYDDRGRVFRTLQHSVNQTNGSDGGALATDFWYDNRDDVIKTKAPGGLVTKNVYDAAGRLVTTYTTDGGGDSSWSDAGNVTGDAVLEQVETTYDDNGNPILITTRQRHDDDTGTGDLASASARVSFVANWYDEADRLTGTVNYGNNGSDSMTNATSGSDIAADLDESAPPARGSFNGWNQYLVTTYDYEYGAYQNVYAYAVTVTDPRGIATEIRYDSLGRKVEVWEAREGTLSQPTPGVDTNRGTLYQYNGFDQLTQEQSRTYLGAGGRNYVTHYNYGVTKGETGKDYHVSNSSLLRSIVYDTTTDGGTVTDQEQFTGYNALGEVTAKTLRDGTEHEYDYSALGQLLSDTWVNTGVWSGQISDWAAELVYAYDALGRIVTATTLDTSLSTSNPKNMVERQFDGLGHLVSEETTINEAGYAGGPSKTVVGTVAYSYDTVFGSSNYSRLKETFYPNDRALWTGYGTAGGLDDRISRPELLADGTPTTIGDTLESYKYLGLDQVVKRAYDGFTTDSGGTFSQSYINDDTWTYDGANDPTDTSFGVDDGGTNDPYNGLDRFGRVIEQGWNNTQSSSLGVTRLYAYDADGNMLYAANPKGGSVENWRSEIYQSGGDDASVAYDQLNRSTHWSRGIITASNGRLASITPSTNSKSNDWGIDASGNFGSTTVDPDQRRVFQAQIPAETETFSQTTTGDPRRDVFVRFDAFGRLANDDTTLLVSGTGFDEAHYIDNLKDLRQYEYDAFGRRILERYVGDGGLEQYSLYLFNDPQGNVLEEQKRFASSSTVETSDQYVRSVADPTLIVLRDRDADGSGGGSGNGDYGFSGSGLDERLWVEQGPDGSVWELWPQGGSTSDKEDFLYSPQGTFDIIWGSTGNTIQDHSQYDWRYFWRGGRAEAFPFDNGTGTYLQYDGLQWMAGSQTEQDVVRGSPLGVDIYAYHDTGVLPAHEVWNYQQTQYAYAGTGGAWSKPDGYYDIGGQIYNPHMEAFTQPAWIDWTSRTTGVVAGLALIPFIGPELAIGAVGGGLAGEAIGAGVGAGVAYAGGWNIGTGASIGADVGMLIGGLAGPGIASGTSSILRSVERNGFRATIFGLAEPGEAVYSRYKGLLRYIPGLRRVSFPNAEISYISGNASTRIQSLAFEHEMAHINDFRNLPQLTDLATGYFPGRGAARYLLEFRAYGIANPTQFPRAIAALMSVDPVSRWYLGTEILGGLGLTTASVLVNTNVVRFE